MRKYENIIKNALGIFFMAMLSVSCLLEKDVPVQDVQSVLVEMSVAGGMTKAAVYEDATDSEKIINSLRIYAFYGNRLAGYAARQSTALGESFYMDLELPESGKHNVNFYIIANEGEMAYENAAVQLSQNMTMAQLKAIRYTGLNSRNSLPMYCEQQELIDVDAVKAGKNTEEGHSGHVVLNQKISFQLSHSLAKLSVYAAKVSGASSDPQVLGVKLLAAGTREYSYLFPQNDATLEAVPSRANDRVLLTSPVTVTKSIVKGSASAEDPASYTPVLADVYLPEVPYGSSIWNITSGNEREAVLHVEYSLGEGLERRNAYVYLPKVERNEHIKVCVLINAEGQIIINYVVADWEQDDNAMSKWYFDYPTHSYLRHNLPLIDEDLDKTPQAAAVMSESQPFVGYFQMTYPDKDTWKPTLWGPQSSNCTVKVYRVLPDVEDELVFESEDPVSIPVSDKWYRIEIYPLTGRMDAGDSVNFSITYTPSGFEEPEYLLINGSHNHYYWPGSSDANYVTITMVN